ncbi:zn-finger domain-containing protein [Gigaspora margarita]|uniref:Zn-finger domain-containing protein n=1 Tax=Gigaspora margarita TaxID=4874 RepID=A0A8H4B2M6_GIGMA|nr:zn-finger domain-containing protein [Gigaspora margarita]
MYKCPELDCDRYFSCYSSFRNHVKTHNNIIEKFFQEITIKKGNEIDSLVFDSKREIENNEPGLEDKLDGEIDKIANNLESGYSNERSNKDNEVYNKIFNKIDENEVNELEFEEDEIDEMDEIEIRIVECQLFEVEPSLVFESLNGRLTENVSNFPSEEFVSCDNTILPTSIQQRKQFLDQIMVPHISFKRVSIVDYEEKYTI